MKQSNRRQFLKNSTLTVAASTIFTACATGKNSEPGEAANCNPTTLDYYGQGPFYTANAPQISSNVLAPENEPGDRLIISGRVHNLDCSEYIPNAEIDIWHANDAGAYDNSGFHLRGKTLSNSQGFYMFETVKPGHYLNGPTYRPSHIHFKITPPGHHPQLYFSGD